MLESRGGAGGGLQTAEVSDKFARELERLISEPNPMDPWNLVSAYHAAPYALAGGVVGFVVGRSFIVRRWLASADTADWRPVAIPVVCAALAGVVAGAAVW